MIVPGRLEVNPAERQRERDGRGEDASPEDAPVRGPSRSDRFSMNVCATNVPGESAARCRNCRADVGREEQAPAATPVEPRRRRFSHIA